MKYFFDPPAIGTLATTFVHYPTLCRRKKNTKTYDTYNNRLRVYK